MKKESGKRCRKSKSYHRGLARVRYGLVAGLSTGVLLVVAACSGGGSSSSSNGPVTLTIANWDIVEKPLLQKEAAAFHKTHPNITVKVDVIAPSTTYWQKLSTTTTAGNAPDLFTMNAWMVKYYATNNGILPLDNYIKGKDSDINMDNYLTSLKNDFTVDGKVYAVPKSISSFGLCYNKKLFKQAGVAFPTASWTWDDVIAAAKKINDPAKGIYGIAGPSDDTTAWYLTIPQTNGYILAPDGKTSGYNQPNTIKGVQFWYDLLHKYHVSPSIAQMTDTAPDAMLEAGKLGMMYCGSWEPLAFAQIPYAKANLDIAPLPLGPNGTRKFYSNGLGTVIAAKTKHPKEAWEFLNFFGSKKGQQIYAAGGGNVVAWKGSVAEPFAKAFPEFNTQVFLDQLPGSLQFPSTINTQAWQDTTIKDFNTAFTGKSSLQEATAKAAEDMNKLIAAEH